MDTDKSCPKFVKNIKRQIIEKLKHVGEISDLPEKQQIHFDDILNVYREIFSNLINKLVTFKDILSSIKEAYEQAISVRDKRIQQFIVQDRLFGISSAKQKYDKDCEKIMHLNDELYHKNEESSQELKKIMDDMKRLQRESASKHRILMEERDARYTLFFENVNLHMKIKELNGTNNILDTSYGDPVILKIALEQCREQLSVAHKTLKTMSDKYSDTVPRYEYDALELRYFDTKKTSEQLQQDHLVLIEKHIELKDENKSLKEELSDIKERCTDLERSGTPRPQWEICGDFIGGGSERWKQLKKGLTSREILRVILKELGPSAKTEHLEYFDGLGTDPVVPPYLQYDGKVRNLRLSRREISVFINDIWIDKINNGLGTPMQDFVALYFENRYQQPSVRAEWAYNLCFGSEQMLDDPQIKLFWGALNGHLSDDIYLAHRDEWCRLRDELAKNCDRDEIISAEKFERVTKAVFPLKSEVDVKNLVDNARRQLKIKTTTNDVNIGKLFQENEEGFDRLEFAKELYRQRQAAQDKYIKEIIAELGGKTNPNKLITVDNLKRAFAFIDPAIDHIRMEKNIRWAFSDKKSDLSSIYPLPLKVLATKLAAGNIERVGARNKGLRSRKDERGKNEE